MSARDIHHIVGGLMREGLTYAEAGRRCGVSKQRIHQICVEMKIALPGRRKPAAPGARPRTKHRPPRTGVKSALTMAQVAALGELGLRDFEISRALDLDPSTIRGHKKRFEEIRMTSTWKAKGNLRHVEPEQAMDAFRSFVLNHPDNRNPSMRMQLFTLVDARPMKALASIATEQSVS